MRCMTPGRPQPSTLSVALALATVYVIWGSTYLAIAYVVETLPPLLAAGVRFVIAGLLILGFLVARDRGSRKPGRSRLAVPRAVEWRTAIIVGGLLLLGGNGMVSVAEQSVPSGLAAVLIATVPIWMTLFDALLTRRRPSALAGIGLGVGMLGVAILLFPTQGVSELDPVGIGLLVLAAVSWAIGSIYARHGPLPQNQLMGTGMQQLAGGGVILVAALLVGDFGRFDPGQVSTASWLGLVYLIIFGSLLGFTAFVWLLHHVPVTTASTYGYVNPVVAVALGILVRGEQLTPRTIVAAALIIGAVVAMVTGRPREVEGAGPSPEAGGMDTSLNEEVP